MADIAKGYLDTYREEDRLLEVPMSGISFVDFGEKEAIGTGGLGSCTVAMVVSVHGAILAHIPPLPSMPTEAQMAANPYAGENNVHDMMTQVQNVYQFRQPWFPTAAAYIICGTAQGQMVVPHQVAIMQGRFREIGLEPAIHHYDINADRSRPGQGTVIVISNGPGTVPSVYVEDILIGYPSGFEYGGTSSFTGEAATGAGTFPSAYGEDSLISQPLGYAYSGTSSFTGEAATAGLTSEQADFAPGTDQAQHDTTAQERVWKEVRVEIVPHLTRRDEYIFRNVRNQPVSTDRAQWHRAEFQGREVWIYQGRKTTYYTYQKIRQ